MLLYLQENLRKVKITKWNFELMPEDEEPVAGPAAAGPAAAGPAAAGPGVAGPSK